MRTTRRPRAARRGLAVAGGVLVLAGVLVGAYLLGTQDRDNPAPARQPEVVGAPAPPKPVTASTDPVESALAWLRGYRTISYTDPDPSGWVTRVAPVVTDELAREYRATRNAGGDLAWHTYTAQRCTTEISGASAVIPDEAPRSATEVWAQVQGEALTTCEAGPPPAGPSEQVAATVQLLKGTDGRWRVARRLF